MWANACGAIAVNNANNILGVPTRFEDTYYRFHNDGTVFGGLIGTYPNKILKYYEEKGCSTTIYKDPSKVDPGHDAYIALYFWSNDKNPISAHYVSAEFKDGGLIIYNNTAFSNSDTRFSGFDDFKTKYNAETTYTMNNIYIRD